MLLLSALLLGLTPLIHLWFTLFEPSTFIYLGNDNRLDKFIDFLLRRDFSDVDQQEAALLQDKIDFLLWLPEEFAEYGTSLRGYRAQPYPRPAG